MALYDTSTVIPSSTKYVTCQCPCFDATSKLTHAAHHTTFVDPGTSVDPELQRCNVQLHFAASAAARCEMLAMQPVCTSCSPLQMKEASWLKRAIQPTHGTLVRISHIMRHNLTTIADSVATTHSQLHGGDRRHGKVVRQQQSIDSFLQLFFDHIAKQIDQKAGPVSFPYKKAHDAVFNHANASLLPLYAHHDIHQHDE
jgi:hypothetical protein